MWTQNTAPRPTALANGARNQAPGEALAPAETEGFSAPKDLYSLWAEEGRGEEKSLRFSVAAAVLVHALLLLITFPQIYTAELEEPAPRKVIQLAPTPRFRPPPVEVKKTPPKERARIVPIPDPTPDLVEPILREETVEVKLSDIDPLVVTIPDRPPEPEPTTPLPVGGEVSAPVRQHYVAPHYPELARRVRLGGKVVLRAVIDRQGDITDLKVVKSLSFGLTEAAVDAVQQWKFSPGTLRGKPVAVIYHIEVNFELH